jgi:hypothetical protein
MTNSLSQLLEESFQIAWEYLERTGELGDGAAASRFLGDAIEIMIRHAAQPARPLQPCDRRLSAASNVRRNGVQAGGSLVRLTTSLYLQSPNLTAS